MEETTKYILMAMTRHQCCLVKVRAVGVNSSFMVRISLTRCVLMSGSCIWLGTRDVLSGGLLLNIKLDPFERTPDTGGHLLWMKEKSYILPIIMPQINKFKTSMRDFPPRQKGAGIGAGAFSSGKK